MTLAQTRVGFHGSTSAISCEMPVLDEIAARELVAALGTRDLYQVIAALGSRRVPGFVVLTATQ